MSSLAAFLSCPLDNPALMSETSEGKLAAKNINTILLLTTLGVLGFIGNMSYNNSIAISEIKGSVIGRSELDGKLAEQRREFVELMIQVKTLAAKLETLKPNNP